MKFWDKSSTQAVQLNSWCTFVYRTEMTFFGRWNRIMNNGATSEGSRWTTQGATTRTRGAVPPRGAHKKSEFFQAVEQFEQKWVGLYTKSSARIAYLWCCHIICFFQSRSHRKREKCSPVQPTEWIQKRLFNSWRCWDEKYKWNESGK